MALQSIELESFEDARFLFRNARLLYGTTHPITLALGSLVDYWFERVAALKDGERPMLSKEELMEQSIEALHVAMIDQQHHGTNDNEDNRSV